MYVARHPVVRSVVLGLLVDVTFLSVDLVTIVFLARESLDVGGVGYGVLAAAHGACMILGPLLLVRRRSRRVPAGLVVASLAIEGVATVLTGFAPVFAIAFLIRAAGGGGNGLENVAADTALQQVVERRVLGRVFGGLYSGVILAEALGAALAGLLVALTSPHGAFVIAGAAALGIVVPLWLLLSCRAPRRNAPG